MSLMDFEQIFLVLTFRWIPVEQVQELDKGPTDRINAEKATIEMRQNQEKGRLLAWDGADLDTTPNRGDIVALSKDRSAEDHST